MVIFNCLCGLCIFQLFVTTLLVSVCVNVGIGTLFAVTILAIPQLGTQSISKALEWVFLTLLPNFCLGQSLSDFYSNYMFLSVCQRYLTYCPLICAHKKNVPCCKGVIFLFTCIS